MKKHLKYYDLNKEEEICNWLDGIMSEDLIIVGVGTDLCIGDCLGPLVGTMVKEKTNLRVFGSFDNLVHAKNIKSTFEYIWENHPTEKILVIDASLSGSHNYYLEDIIMSDSPIRPGWGVGKTLGEVGDYSIKGVVDMSDGYNNLDFTNRKHRLGLTYGLAKTISEGIIKSYNKVVLGIENKDIIKV